jgi:two-component system, LytTR family, sensor kinase
VRRQLSQFWKLQLAGWGAFYVAMALSRVGRFPLLYMLTEKLPLTVLGLGASLVLRRILQPMLRRQVSLPRVVAVCVVASYLLTTVWTALFNLSGIPIAKWMLGQTYSIDSLGALLSGTVYHAFALVAWGFLYIGIKHHQAWQAERERALRAQALAAEARLGALQSQLNPHFFFNSLNAISTLVTERRNEEAAAMIARLGDLLRATFARRDASLVTLGDELELVQRYLEIERVRFEDRLRVELDVAEAAFGVRVPLLILQPLVENAIRHGIARLPDGGVVELSARVSSNAQGPWLEIALENTAPADGNGASPGAGFGLANVRERLEMIHGGHFHVSGSRTDRGTFRVELGMPASPAGQSSHS